MIYKRCGHRGRSRDTCEHPWWSQIKYRGRKIQVSLEKYCGQRVRGRGAKSVAQDVQRELKSHIKNGKYFEWKNAQVPVNGDITVAQFLDTYVEEHMKARRLSSYRSSERWKIDRVRKRWGKRRLRDLRQIDILSFLNDLRKKDVQPSTVRRHYARINHMLNWAERYEYIDHNPLKKGAFELGAPPLHDRPHCQGHRDELTFPLLQQARREVQHALPCPTPPHMLELEV